MCTNRASWSYRGEQYTTQPPPGGSDEKRWDENSSRHRQAVSPTRQEEIGQSEQTQRQRIVGPFKEQNSVRKQYIQMCTN